MPWITREPKKEGVDQQSDSDGLALGLRLPSELVGRQHQQEDRAAGLLLELDPAPHQFR